MTDDTQAREPEATEDGGEVCAHCHEPMPAEVRRCPARGALCCDAAISAATEDPKSKKIGG